MIRSKRLNGFIWCFCEKALVAELKIAAEMVKAEIDGLIKTTYYSTLKFKWSVYVLRSGILKELDRRTAPKVITFKK